MSDWRRLLAETETAQTHPFNPLNPTLSSQTDNLKDKKDHFAGFENQVGVAQRELPAVPPPGLNHNAETPQPPKFTPGQHVLITDNENHVRSGVIQFADWKDLPLCAKEWWYVVLDVYGHLSETHESRLRERGL